MKSSCSPIFGSSIHIEQNVGNCSFSKKVQNSDICTNTYVTEWDETFCIDCKLFKHKNHDLTNKIKNRKFVNYNLISLVILFIICFTISLILIHYDLVKLSTLKKIVGITISAFGLIITSTKPLVELRKQIKNIELYVKKKIESSVIYEYIAYPSEEIKATITIITAIAVSYFIFGDGMKFILEKYKDLWYIWILFAIPFLGVMIAGYLILFIAKSITKVFNAIAKGFLFLPRTIFWLSLIIGSKFNQITRLKHIETIGIMISIIGMIILAL